MTVCRSWIILVTLVSVFSVSCFHMGGAKRGGFPPGGRGCNSCGGGNRHGSPFIGGQTHGRSPSAPSPAPESGGTTYDQALLNAVASVNAPLRSGPGHQESSLCQAARQHLDYMISIQNINHKGFNDNPGSDRASTIGARGEIVAMNSYGSPGEAAGACAVGWKNRRGHAFHMYRGYQNYCYSMKRSSNGMYYCIGLFR